MSFGSVVRRLLWASVGVGLLFYVGLSLWLAFAAIGFPYQLDYGEGIVLWFTRELALGHSIYKGLEGLPYASSNYPPLMMVLAVPFRWALGDSYAGGRFLNFASTLVVAALIWRIVRGENGFLEKGARNFIAALSALFFLGSTFIYHWIGLFRIDLPGLAFTVGGIYFVWKWQRSASGPVSQPTRRGRRLDAFATPPNRYLFFALVLFLLALYTKHSLLFAPAASAVAVFLRDRRTAVLWSAALAASGGIIFAALDWLTHGGLFFGLVTSNASLWLWGTFVLWTWEFAYDYGVLIVLAALGWGARVAARRVGVLELYGLAAAASILLAGRVGAWENYYFEAIVATCVLAGIALGPVWQRAPQARWWLPLALLLQLALFWNKHDPAIASELLRVTQAGNQQVGPLVRAAQGTVISEDMGLLVTNGKPVEYYTFQYSMLAEVGRWDQKWELENLEHGNFPLVILNPGTREDVDRFRDFTRAFVSALDYGYRLARADARYRVYAPAPLAHLSKGDFGGQLEMVGWNAAPDGALKPGQALTVEIVWRARQKLETNYTAFVHLEREGGGNAAQDDHPPRVGPLGAPALYPTTRWGAGEMMRDTYVLRVPSDLPSGAYALRAGWYDPESGDRLSLADGNDFVQLAEFRIP